MIIFYALISLTIILSFIAMYRTEKLSQKYSNYRNGLHITGQELVKKFLKDNNIEQLEITHNGGDDYFDVDNLSINLSDNAYGRDTGTSLAISAHECGHVPQAKNDKFLLRFKRRFVAAVNVAIYIGIVALAIGYILKVPMLMYIATFFLAIASLFQLFTLPLEIDASRRALKYLKTQNLSDEELKAIKKLLVIAAISYLGNLFLNIVRLFSTTWHTGKKSLSLNLLWLLKQVF